MFNIELQMLCVVNDKIYNCIYYRTIQQKSVMERFKPDMYINLVRKDVI